MTKPIPTAIAAQAMLMGATALFIEGGATAFSANVISDPDARAPTMDRLKWNCSAFFESHHQAAAIYQKVIASQAFDGTQLGMCFVRSEMAFFQGEMTESHVQPS